MPDQSLNALSRKGRLYARDRDTAGEQFTAIGNLTKFEPTMEVEKNQVVSTGDLDEGQTLASEATITATSLNMAFNAFSRNGLNLVFGAVSSAWTQSASDAATETVVVIHDQWIPLAKRRLSDVSVAGLTVNDDYAVDLERGRILFHSTGDAVAEAEKVVTYDAAAITGVKTSAFRKAAMNVELRFEGTDKVTGDKLLVIIPHAEITAQGADLMAKGFPEVEMVANLIQDPSHPVFDTSDPSTMYEFRYPAE